MNALVASQAKGEKICERFRFPTSVRTRSVSFYDTLISMENHCHFMTLGEGEHRLQRVKDLAPIGREDGCHFMTPRSWAKNDRHFMTLRAYTP